MISVKHFMSENISDAHHDCKQESLITCLQDHEIRRFDDREANWGNSRCTLLKARSLRRSDILAPTFQRTPHLLQARVMLHDPQIILMNFPHHLSAHV